MLSKSSALTIFLIICTATCLASVKGKVIEIYSSEPLSLVRVESIPGNDIRLTDRNGDFSFDKIEAGKLIFSRIGYKNRELKLHSGKEFLLITMEPETIELPGIVVKGEKVNSISDKASNLEVMDFGSNFSNKFLKKLEANSGIFIKENAAGEKQITLNGCDENQIAIMVDGEKINNSAFEHPLNHIPVSLIDKIEIAKGSNSVLAGSSAIGGVINFILKNPKADRNRHTFSCGFGSWDNYSGNYQGAFYKNKIKMLLNLHAETARNNFTYYNEIEEKEMRRSNNEYTSSSVQLKLNHPLHKNVNQMLSFFTQKAEKGTPGQTTDYMYYQKAKTRSKLSRFHSKTIFDLSYSLIKLNLNLQDQTSHYENKDADIFHKYDSKNRTKLLSAKTEWEYSKNNFSHNAGIKFRYESYKFDNLLDESREESIPLKIRRTLSFMNNCILNIPNSRINFSLNPGLRYDYVMDEENIFSADLGLTLEPKKADNIILLLKAGSSYRLPQFTSLFWKGDSRVQGNPELKVERARSAESKLIWQKNSQQISLEAFINEIDNLIYWHRSALGIWKPDNLAAAEISGITTKLQFKLWDNLKISSNFTRLYPLNKTKKSDHYNNYLIYKPLYKWVNNIQLLYKNVNLYFISNTTGKQYVNFDNQVFLNGYNTCDIGGSFHFKPFQKTVSSINLSITNLFSESYQTYRNIPAAGRGFNLYFEVTLK